MRYEIIDKGDLQIIHVLGYNIFFGYDTSTDYDVFREALNTKGIEVFIDLLISDSNSAFLTFIA